MTFPQPQIVYSDFHISGLPEVGIGYGGQVEYLILPKRIHLKAGETIEPQKLQELKSLRLGVNQDFCACCKSPNITVIDRGVSLCRRHEEMQERKCEKRPDYFVKDITKYNEKDPSSIIF